jgi:hypothetical protein
MLASNQTPQVVAYNTPILKLLVHYLFLND